jgi:hypothetical protein
VVTGADCDEVTDLLSVTGGTALPADAATGHVALLGDVEGAAAAGQVAPGAPRAGAGVAG